MLQLSIAKPRAEWHANGLNSDLPAKLRHRCHLPLSLIHNVLFTPFMATHTLYTYMLWLWFEVSEKGYHAKGHTRRSQQTCQGLLFCSACDSEFVAADLWGLLCKPPSHRSLVPGHCAVLLQHLLEEHNVLVAARCFMLLHKPRTICISRPVVCTGCLTNVQHAYPHMDMRMCEA